MQSILEPLIEVTKALTARPELDELLKLIAGAAARITGTERASIRMLSPAGDKLLAIARSATSFHLNPSEEFRYGEGLMGWIVAHRESIRSGDAEADPRFVPRPGMKSHMGSFLGVPLVVGKGSLGVICAIHPQKDYFTDLHEQGLTLLAGICAPQVEIARLSRLATVDPLTGAHNRRAMERLLAGQASGVAPTDATGAPDAATAPERPMSVIMADIDHFKHVNDTYGHLTGDLVLKQVATLLSSVLRAGDAVVRYGGEEFLVVLPGVAATRAFAIAERARLAVEAAEFHLHELTFHISISMGVAQARPGEARDSLVERADAALYEAKNGGRNRSVVAP